MGMTKKEETVRGKLYNEIVDTEKRVLNAIEKAYSELVNEQMADDISLHRKNLGRDLISQGFMWLERAFYSRDLFRNDYAVEATLEETDDISQEEALRRHAVARMRLAELEVEDRMKDGRV